MRPINIPASSDAEQIKTLGSNTGLTSIISHLESRYLEYRNTQGNPWSISDSTVSPAFGLLLQKLYESRRRSASIEAIRRPSGLCCPMCGSLASGSVDHYLPKDAFPEFSIFLPNLVSACSFCNSNAKGNVYKGAAPPEKFVHPYFDPTFAMPSWLVSISPPFLAPKFVGVTMAAVTGDDALIISFHLSHVLRADFLSYMRGKWAAIPQMLRDRFPHEALSQEKLLTLILEQRKFSYGATNANSWDSALWRGINMNIESQAFLLLEAKNCAEMPTNLLE